MPDPAHAPPEHAARDIALRAARGFAVASHLERARALLEHAKTAGGNLVPRARYADVAHAATTLGAECLAVARVEDDGGRAVGETLAALHPRDDRWENSVRGEDAGVELFTWLRAFDLHHVTAPRARDAASCHLAARDTAPVAVIVLTARIAASLARRGHAADARVLLDDIERLTGHDPRVRAHHASAVAIAGAHVARGDVARGRSELRELLADIGARWTHRRRRRMRAAVFADAGLVDDAVAEAGPDVAFIAPRFVKQLVDERRAHEAITWLERSRGVPAGALPIAMLLASAIPWLAGKEALDLGAACERAAASLDGICGDRASVDAVALVARGGDFERAAWMAERIESSRWAERAALELVDAAGGSIARGESHAVVATATRSGAAAQLLGLLGREV